MKLSENAQELLEQLWMAIEEEAQAGLSVTDNQTDDIDELVRLGLAGRTDHQLMLTAAGRPEAAQAVRRHRLAERLLADVLMTEEGLIDDQACRLEHTLFDGLDDSVCTLLGHPQFCPHGRPIPPGPCCQDKQLSVDRLIAPLSEMKAGQYGRIAYIHMNNPVRLQKLMAMGVLPGVPITLLRDFPSFVFEAGHSQFAVDETIAGDVYVRLMTGVLDGPSHH